jgi:hypothetical protein
MKLAWEKIRDPISKNKLGMWSQEVEVRVW